MTDDGPELEPLDVPAPWAHDPAPAPAPAPAPKPTLEYSPNPSPEPSPGPSPAPDRRAPTALVVGVIAAMLLAGMGGYFVADRLQADTPFDAAAAQTPSGSVIPGAPTAPADPDAAVLRRLGVQQADVGATHSVELIPNGAEVVGTTTLDLCNGTYPSESLRRARFQVVDREGSTTALSTEAVLYRNPAAAGQAFAELRTVREKCPHAPVRSPAGEPTVATTFRASPDKAWPATATVERLAYDFDTVDQQNQKSRSIAVYLRRGRVLVGVYFPQPDGAQPPVADQTTVAGITRVLAQRIAALPPAVVNRHA